MGTGGAGEGRGKLVAGARVALLHPGWDRSCAACETYRVREDGTYSPDKRTGLPMLRPAGVPTPCHKCPKVPAAARDAGLDWRELRKLAADMTPANRAALDFYLACRAVGRFPDDPLVGWYAPLVRDVEDLGRRVEHVALMSALAGLAARR